jgi:triosephosphate isomerase (TIM)
MKRQKIIAGNWKMYKTAKEAVHFIQQLQKLIPSSKARILLAVPFTALTAAAEAAHTTSFAIGAQNVHEAVEGPYTGEISAHMLKEAGAKFTLIGHSERRRLFHESNLLIHQKIKRALSSGLTPILCVGETLVERSDGATEAVLAEQLEEGLGELSLDQLAHLVIAYEPVWAIGTGKSASPQVADEAHLLCRNFIAKKWGSAAAEQLPILYGGSVKAENAAELLNQPNVDGALVGGASLDPAAFAQIIQSVG